MKDLQALKDEIHRRGEERIVQIAATRRRVRAVCGGAVLCGVMALVVTTYFINTKNSIPLVPGSATTTTHSSASTTTLHGADIDTLLTSSTVTSGISGAATTDATAPSQATLQDPSSAVSSTTARPVISTSTTRSTVSASTATAGTAPITSQTASPTTSPITSPTATSVTTPTTTATNRPSMKPPMDSVVDFVTLGLSDAEGKVNDTLFVTFSAMPVPYLVRGQLDVVYDPTVVTPVAVNGNNAANAYVGGINEANFPSGTTFTSSLLEDGLMQIQFNTNRSSGTDASGNTLFYLAFRAVAPTSSTQLYVSNLSVVSVNGSNSEHDFVWSAGSSTLVIRPID